MRQHLSRAIVVAATIRRLGWRNTAFVAAYRVVSRLGLVAPDPCPPASASPRFRQSGSGAPWSDDRGARTEASELADGRLRGLGELELPFEFPPDWSLNRLNQRTSDFSDSWWKGSDSDPRLGDIKGVWEASRFDWALGLARSARHGDTPALERLNALVASWVTSTPPYRTLNWRCGQEASIRMVQLLLAARLLGQDGEASEEMTAFVRLHVDRILPSISYAIAQDNDHGFSESCALLVGGGWLERFGTEASRSTARRALRVGRRWLEDRVSRLVLNDGGTANYSVNYHRFILDWLSHVELWRRRFALPAFSDQFYGRARAATECLDTLTAADGGDAPNTGANDGVRAFRLENLPFRDFRPSVQLAYAVFFDRRRYGPGPWDEPLAWLGLEPPGPLLPATRHTRIFDDFGMAVVAPRPDSAYAFLKVPRSRFRPPQADPLHLDLWTADGINLLRDTGSFSYFDTDDAESFCGVRGHNTVQFDRREPMRRVSRFLYADWLQGSAVKCDAAPDGWTTISASYRDRTGARHNRSVCTDGETWRVSDSISGHNECAILRWHLAPGPWSLTEGVLSGERARLEISADGPIKRIALVGGYEARGYGARTPIQVLEVEVGPSVHLVESVITPA